MNILREDSYISLQSSYILVEVEVTHIVNANTQYVENIEIGLVNLGPIALFFEANLSKSSNKILEKVESLHTVSLLHKLLSSCAKSTDLLFRFDSNKTHRRLEFTNNKKAGQRGVFFNKIRLFDFIGFADQHKISYCLRYNLILKRDINSNAIYRTTVESEAKIAIRIFAGYVEKITPTLDNQQSVADQMLSKTPTELYYEERTVFRKRFKNAGTWELQLGIESGKNILSFVIIACMENDKFGSQTHDNSAFFWLPMSSAVCRLGSERYLDN